MKHQLNMGMSLDLALNPIRYCASSNPLRMVAQVILMISIVLSVEPLWAQTDTVDDGGECMQTVDSATGVEVKAVGSECIVIFKENNTWTRPAGVTSVDYLIVGGGGAGGDRFTTQNGGGGGGGGGFLEGNVGSLNQATYGVQVGQGGDPDRDENNDGSGEDSSAFGLTAQGGGSGGRLSDEQADRNGGSGGGGFGQSPLDGGVGTQGQGRDGGDGEGGVNANSRAGGGGGGAGESGQKGGTVDNTGGDGGDGLSSEITGTEVFYAGGGGGGASNNNSGFFGGSGGSGGGGGGGGRNNEDVAEAPEHGGANTGGGGGGLGGGSDPTNLGAPGGSGIVVIRYQIPPPALDITANGETGTSGAGWSTSEANNTVTVSISGEADINASVIEGSLNAGKNVVIEMASPEASDTITIEAPIAKTSGGSATFTVDTDGIITIDSTGGIDSNADDLDIIFQAGAKIEVDGPITTTGVVSMAALDVFINAAVEATNNRISLISLVADDLNGTLENLSGGDIQSDELLIRNFHRWDLLSQGVVAVNTFATDGGGGFTSGLRNTQALTIGTVAGVNGIVATGPIQVETTTGNLGVSQPVTSQASGFAITLNAGKNSNVGDAQGGDILITGSGSVTASSGIARLYSGSPANSTGLSAIADGVFVFYDAASSPGLVNDGVYAIYRDTTPAKLIVQAQPTSTAASGVVFPDQPQVRITDAFDNVIRTDNSSQITAAIVSGDNGTLLGTSTATVSAGIASFTDLALQGPVTNAYRLRFSSASLASADSTSFTITDPGPVSLSASDMTATPNSGITADGTQAATLTVTVTDAYGNPRPSETVVLALSTNADRMLGVSSGSTNGSGQVTTTLSSTVAETTTVSAYLGSEAVSNLIGDVSVDFVAGAPAQIDVPNGNNQQDTVDVELDTPIKVRVRDAQGNVVANESIQFTGPGSTVPEDGLVDTNAQGEATIEWRLGTTSGSQTLTATLVSDASIQAQIQATADPDEVAGFQFTTPDDSAQLGPQLRSLPFDVKVGFVDAFDNETSYAGTSSKVVLTAQTLNAGQADAVAGELRNAQAPTTPVELDVSSGDASLTFSDILYTGLSAPEGGQDIVMTATGVGGDLDGIATDSQGFSVRDIEMTIQAASSSLVADGQNQTNIVVTLTDADGLPQTGQNITIETDLGTLLVGGGALTNPLVTGADGQVDFVLRTGTVAGPATVTARCPGACPVTTTVAFVGDVSGLLGQLADPNSPPSVQVYEDTGITGVDGTNLAEVNALINVLPADQKTNPEQIQASIDALNQSFANADGNPSTTPSLDADDYAALGLPAIADGPTSRIDLMNNVLGSQPSLTTYAKLTDLTNVVERLSEILLGEDVSPPLSTQELELIGVDDVNADNIAFMNDILGVVSADQVATLQDLQGSVDAMNEVLASADGDPSATPSLSASDYQALGLSGITDGPASGVDLMNSVIANQDDLETYADLTALADVIERLSQFLSGQTVDPSLSAEELVLIGVEDVGAGNLQSILTALLTEGPSDLASLQAIQAIVDKTVQAANQLLDSNNASPEDPQAFEQAGITGVDGGNLELVNDLIAALPSDQKQTPEQLQESVDAMNEVLDKADGDPSSAPNLSASDYQALGLSGITDGPANGVDLMNSVIANQDDLASYADLTALADVIERVVQVLNGERPEPSLTVADFSMIGITGVNGSNLSVVLAAIASNEEPAINSLASLQRLINDVPPPLPVPLLRAPVWWILLVALMVGLVHTQRCDFGSNKANLI